MLGRTLGNYAVVKKLGEGGMGVVYLARHATLGRLAAIKVLRPALSADPDIISRFFNEARAVTAIRHPGIVEAYDFGFLEDKTAYIIMEYLDGESLAMRMRRGLMPVSKTLSIIRAIARSLQAAHAQGIVHRDLKPDNVFLVPDSDLPSGERVKLLDFGIAKLAHGVGNTNHTSTGTVMGTPTYMSPEQCRGSGSIDHRADLYSLGCLAYEMLCGQPPFIADGPGDVIARHLYFEPVAPRSHRSEIAAELEELVLRLLKKEPKARHGSAADVVRALDQWMKATPTQPLPIITSAPTEFVPTMPLLKDTTLKSAAAESAVRPKQPQPSSKPRVSLRVGLAALTAALAIFAIVVFVVRGAHESEPSTGAIAQTNAAKPAELAEGMVATVPPPPPPPPPAHAEPASPVAPSPHGEPASSVAPSPHGEPASPVAPNVESAPPPTARVDPPGAPPATTSQKPSSARSPLLARPSTGAQPPASPPSASESSPTPATTLPVPVAPTPPAPATDKDPTHGDPDAANGSDDKAAKGAEPAPKPSTPDKSSHETPAPKSTGKPGNGGKPPSPGVDGAPLDKSQCVRSAFAPVLDATHPSRAAINGAWTRLGRCKGVLPDQEYDKVQDALLEKT